jgi:HSP20 family protein
MRKTLFPDFADNFLGRDFLAGFMNDEIGITQPGVNIVEGKEDFRIEVAAPGLNKDDFKVELENKMLKISAEMEKKQEEENDHFMRREFNYSSFCRTFILPDTVDGEKIQASHSNGVLTLVLPKRDEAKVKPLKVIKVS